MINFLDICYKPCWVLIKYYLGCSSEINVRHCLTFLRCSFWEGGVYLEEVIQLKKISLLFFFIFLFSSIAHSYTLNNTIWKVNEYPFEYYYGFKDFQFYLRYNVDTYRVVLHYLEVVRKSEKEKKTPFYCSTKCR